MIADVGISQNIMGQELGNMNVGGGGGGGGGPSSAALSSRKKSDVSSARLNVVDDDETEKLIRKKTSGSFKNSSKKSATSNNSMKKALAELLSDHHGRDYEQQMRQAAKKAIDEERMNESLASRKRSEVFGKSSLPTMYKLTMMASGGDETKRNREEDGDDVEEEEGDGRWVWKRSRSGLGGMRWQHSQFSDAEDDTEGDTVAAAPSHIPPMTSNSAATSCCVTFSEEEYQAAELWKDAFQWRDNGNAAVELPNKRSKKEDEQELLPSTHDAAPPQFVFDYHTTQKLFELVGIFGDINLFAVHDRLCAWWEGTHTTTPPPSYVATAFRYHQCARAILMARKKRLIDVIRQSERNVCDASASGEGTLFKDDDECEHAISTFSSIVDAHPVLQPGATGTSDNSNTFEFTAGGANATIDVDQQRYFFDETDATLAARFRRTLSAAIDKLATANVENQLHSSEYEGLKTDLEPILSRFYREQPTKTILHEAETLIPPRIISTIDAQNELMPPRVYSRLEDVIVLNFPQQQKKRLHVSQVREVETAIEKHLEDYLNSDSDECREVIGDIRVLLAQNIALHRAVGKKQRLQQEIQHVGGQLEELGKKAMNS